MAMLRGCLLAIGVISYSCAALAQAPSYNASSIVNASDFSPGPFAPGSLISIFGTNLAFGTASLTADNVNSATLPFLLGNISVVIDNVSAPLLYVSPTQINVMIPPNEISGAANLQVVRQSSAGPVVSIKLATAAPALFVGAGHFALAQDYNASYAVATAAAPAKPGDLLVLYATGLGGTQPLPATGQIPQFAGFINGFTTGALQVLLNGKALDPKTIPYAGLTPGFAGLYQINFYLPSDCPPNPTIQLAMGGQLSAANVMLPVAAPQQ
jgi:uncharacterized protein (TIGR03437 family)